MVNPIVDFAYESSVSYAVTKASRNDIPIAQRTLRDQKKCAHILRYCECLSADQGGNAGTSPVSGGRLWDETSD